MGCVPEVVSHIGQGVRHLSVGVSRGCGGPCLPVVDSRPGLLVWVQSALRVGNVDPLRRRPSTGDRGTPSHATPELGTGCGLLPQWFPMVWSQLDDIIVVLFACIVAPSCRACGVLDSIGRDLLETVAEPA